MQHFHQTPAKRKIFTLGRGKNFFEKMLHRAGFGDTGENRCDFVCKA
jgi:hypothetical protein